ncbi:hypothetical protein pb186bvf_006227 [Paramecium bursaria]
MNKAIILALVIALTTSQYVSTGFTNTFTSGPLQISWRTDSSNIYFGVVYNASQWFGLGIYNNSAANATIVGDVWAFNLINNTVVGYDYYLIATGWFPDAVNQTINVTGYAITNTSVSVNFNRALNTNSSTDIPLNLTNAYSLFYTTSSGNVTNTSAPVTNITQTLSSATGKINYAGLIGLAFVVSWPFDRLYQRIVHHKFLILNSQFLFLNQFLILNSQFLIINTQFLININIHQMEQQGSSYFIGQLAIVLYIFFKVKFFAFCYRTQKIK